MLARVRHRIPFTIIVFGLVLIAGIVMQTGGRDAWTSLMDTFGWGLPALKAGKLYELWVGLLFSSEPGHYESILAVLVLGAGSLEYWYGTRQAIFGFLVIGPLASLLTTLLLWGLITAGVTPVIPSLVGPDMGSSSSSLACWGLFLAYRRGVLRNVLMGATLFSLVLLLFLLDAVYTTDHLMAFSVALAVGIFWKRRRRGAESTGDPDAPRQASIYKRWPVWLVAFVTFANGVLNVLPLVLAHGPRPHFLGLALPFGVYRATAALGLIFGFGLIYLSFQLLQRKRAAWWAAVLGLAFLIVLHLVRGHFWQNTLFSAGALTILLVYRRQFFVRSAVFGMLQGVLALAASVILAVLYGTLGFWFLDQRDFGINFHMGEALVRTLREYSLIGNSDLVPRTRDARFFLESLRLVGITAAAFAVYSIFRPVAYRMRTLPQERSLVGSIAQTYGRSTNDYFKVWPDKSYFFSDSRESVVAYRVSTGVAISLGDPIGPETELKPVAEAFSAFCTANGWTSAYYQTLPDLLDAYRHLRFSVLKIGEEAIVDLERLKQETARAKQFKHIVHRLGERSFEVKRYVPPHPAQILNEAHEISDEWLSTPGRRERSFTLGRFERDYVAQSPLVFLRDPAGRAVAFVNEIPAYRPNTATIDLMRHRQEVPNGAMDYLLLQLMLRLRSEEYRWFSLGLAPLSGVGEQPGAPLQERAMRQLFEYLNRFFSYKGLRRYKAKFDPIWEERFLIYQGGPAGLIKTALALVRITEG